MNQQAYSDDLIRSILKSVKTIALVGASANTERPSWEVMNFLLNRGYDIIPINPGLAGNEILGQEVYRSLADVPKRIDMVDIFRNSESAGEVTDEVLALPSLPDVIWMQIGVINDGAAKRAQSKGIKVIMNRCPRMELMRLGKL